MILETALSISLSIDRHHIQHGYMSTMHNTSPIITELVEDYQFTTKDINPNPYDYIKTKNQQLLNEQMIRSLDSYNQFLQDEEDKK